MATGHNTDDIAATVLVNILRGNLDRSSRSTAKSKIVMTVYKKEIVMYAYFTKMLYFSRECLYARNAYRGILLKDMKKIDTTLIMNITHSGKSIKNN